ncbi:MAG: hypothetical protein HY272_09440 [Gammaproteobacteria bacterium]|nr:hypothetical protein [Gammaproteobacteria bacterium]
MTPPEHTQNEAITREAIDQKLIAAGWIVQDKKRINLFESLGVAIRERCAETCPAYFYPFDYKADMLLRFILPTVLLGQSSIRADV